VASQNRNDYSPLLGLVVLVRIQEAPAGAVHQGHLPEVRQKSSLLFNKIQNLTTLEEK